MLSSQERRKLILKKLQEVGSLSLEQIGVEFKISAMTANRDVQFLAGEGLIKRVHGGIVLPDPPAEGTDCILCHGPVSNRTQFLYIADSGQRQACCCPHCGLATAGRFTAPLGVFATDFLYGTMINALEATYVIGSQVGLCCEPSVLAFQKSADALAFRTGFGGQALNYSETYQFLFPARQTVSK
jgi:hypothetical protein